MKDPHSVELYGSENAGNFGRLNFVIKPCNLGYEPGVQPPDNPECLLTKEEQVAFLEPSNFIFLYNSERIADGEFGMQDRIIKESVFVNQ